MIEHLNFGLQKKLCKYVYTLVEVSVMFSESYWLSVSCLLTTLSFNVNISNISLWIALNI